MARACALAISLVGFPDAAASSNILLNRGPIAAPGQYVVRLDHGDQTVEKVFSVLPPPGS